MKEFRLRLIIRTLFLALVYLVAGCTIAIILCSCRTTKYVPVEKIKYDSIAIHDTIVEQKLITYHDSIVTENDSSFLSNPYAYSYAKTLGGKLYHSLGIWPFASTRVQVPYFIDRYHTSVDTKIVEVEKELTWWQRFRLDAFPYLTAALLLFLCYIFRKQILSLFH